MTLHDYPSELLKFMQLPTKNEVSAKRDHANKDFLLNTIFADIIKGYTKNTVSVVFFKKRWTLQLPKYFGAN